MSGLIVVNWLFMLGLLLIGAALLAGVATRLAGYSGSLFMVLLWASSLPLANTPLVDEHLIYIALLWIIYFMDQERHSGLGGWWSKLSMVRRYKFLQ